MGTLIIYAHPGTPAHNPIILKEIVNFHKKRKLGYELIDLYKIKYDPILHEEEHYTSGNKKISKQNKEFQKKILATDKIIFIYPVWWSTMPAILKGWVDRILTPGFSYKFERGIPKGLLKGKKAAVFMTSGSSRVMMRIFLGDRPIKIISKDILGFCGVKNKVFLVDKATRLDEKQKDKIKNKVKKGMKWLF